MKGDEEIRVSLKGGDSWEINRKAEEEGEILFVVRKQCCLTIRSETG